MFRKKAKETDATNELLAALLDELRALREELGQTSGVRQEEGVTFKQIVDEWQNGGQHG